MLQVHAINGPTGRLLKEMLREKGLLVGQVRGAVNYGYYGVCDGLPTLNAKAGTLNKYQELVELDEAGVRTVPFSQDFRDFHQGTVLGRKLHHTRGRDIVFYRAGEIGPKRDFYTGLIPKQNEFRVWVFRNKALATYEKKLTYHDQYGKRGRSKEVWNWANGFAYEFTHPEQVEGRLKALAVDAIAALDLDFGAVDILLGADRRYYVLEVNTAPGVEGRRQGITSLVNCIERWATNGFKARGGD